MPLYVQDKNPTLIIVRHANCLDGDVSSMIEEAAQRERGVQDVKRIAYRHFAPEDSEKEIRAALTPGAQVSFVDIAPRRDFLDELVREKNVGGVSIIDHHQTAARELAGYSHPLVDVCIDETRESAAGYAWKLRMPDQHAPDLIHVMNWMDGSSKGLNTMGRRAIAAHIDEVYNAAAKRGTVAETLHKLFKMSATDMCTNGIQLLQGQEEKIDRWLNNVSVTRLQIQPSGDAAVIPIATGNVEDYGRMASHRLVRLGKTMGMGIGATYWNRPDGGVTLQMRSAENSPVNAEQAVNYLKTSLKMSDGISLLGGGHDHCAALHFPSAESFHALVPLTNLAAGSKTNIPRLSGD